MNDFLCANHKVYLPQLKPRLCHCVNIVHHQILVENVANSLVKLFG